MHGNPGSTQGRGSVSGRGRRTRVASVALVPGGKGPKGLLESHQIGIALGKRSVP